MSAVVVQVSARGEQDRMINVNPQGTLFKAKYSRPSHFGMAPSILTFNNTPAFGQRATVPVERSGDIVKEMTLRTTLPAITAAAAASGSGLSWVANVGHQLIRSVELSFGGIVIDKHYSEWLDIRNYLFTPAGHADTVNELIGNKSTLTGTEPGFAVAAAGTIPATMIMVPLRFSANTNAGTGLPLAALGRHPLKLVFEFRTFAELIRGVPDGSTYTLGDTTIIAEYVHLTDNERDDLIQTPSAHLIEQLQKIGNTSTGGSLNVRLRTGFNHPVKSLHVLTRRDDVTNSGAWPLNTTLNYTNYTDNTDASAGSNPVDKMKILINNQDRVVELEGMYFSTLQHYQHYPRGGPTGLNGYSYALWPAQYAPSGTFNYSAIDSSEVQLTLASSMSGVNATVDVFAVNYNALRWAGGVGGLGFAA